MTFGKKGWRFVKLNPIIAVMLVIIFMFGIILIAISPMAEWDTDSDTQTVRGSGGYGHGRELVPGDELEITYSTSGIRPDVYFVRSSDPHFFEPGEDIIEFFPNSGSGTIKYTVEEKDYYMIFFDGEDFTVSYTYKVKTSWLSLMVILVGLSLIIMGIILLWKTIHIKNPMYIGNFIQYGLITFVILDAILILFIFISREEPGIIIIPLVLTLVSMLINYFIGRAIGGHYQLITKVGPKETVEKVKHYLKENEIEYKQDELVREFPYKWQYTFRLEESSIRIKILKLKRQEWKTMVLIGKRTKRSKPIVIALTNEIGKELECENYKPIKY